MSGMPIALMEDNPPLIRFRSDVKEDRTATMKNGKISYKSVNIVSLTPHGDNKTVVEHEAEEWLAHLRERLHSKQISQNYFDFCKRAFESWEKQEEIPLNGTPIKGWQLATAAQQKLLQECNILTVEELARATEDAIQSIGMGARALKDRAVNWLADAESHGKTAMRMEAMSTELATSKEENAKLAEQIQELQAQMSELNKPKRGRPRKEEE